MSHPVEQRLQEKGFTLPEASAPVANYVPTVESGSMLFVSGQVAMKDGKIAVAGHLGSDVTLDEGVAAAQICALNILSQVKAALGGFDRVKRVVKLGGFVASTPDFTDHPKVVNGASDLMVLAFGDAGKHARFAVGVPALPLNSAVEVDAIFELAD